MLKEAEMIIHLARAREIAQWTAGAPGNFMSRLQRSGVCLGSFLGLHRPDRQAGRADSDPGYDRARLQRARDPSPELTGSLSRLILGWGNEKQVAVAKAHFDSVAVVPGLKSRHISQRLFQEPLKARARFSVERGADHFVVM